MKKISLMALITMVTLAQGSYYTDEELPTIRITDFDDGQSQEVFIERIFIVV